MWNPLVNKCHAKIIIIFCIILLSSYVLSYVIVMY